MISISTLFSFLINYQVQKVIRPVVILLGQYQYVKYCHINGNPCSMIEQKYFEKEIFLQNCLLTLISKYCNLKLHFDYRNSGVPCQNWLGNPTQCDIIGKYMISHCWHRYIVITNTSMVVAVHFISILTRWIRTKVINKLTNELHTITQEVV